ncbi:hypothetical protein P9112_011074 [Eukaryota sp. TZLM1-RC]
MTLPRSLLYFILLVSLCSAFGTRKVLLTEVETLYFHAGKTTTYRNAEPIPQMRCVGGSARRLKHQPASAMCRNVGIDGNDVVWECSADVPSNTRLGRVEVSCEGWDYPEDPYVVTGSCGLEYELHYITKPPVFAHSHSPGAPSPNKILGFALVVSLIFVVFCVFCAKQPSVPREHHYPSPNAPDNVPIYPDVNDHFGDHSTRYRPPRPRHGGHHNDYPSSAPPLIRPGFWSGTFMGYLLGRRSGVRHSTGSRLFSGTTSSRPSFSHRRSSSTRRSTAFGGTSRR